MLMWPSIIVSTWGWKGGEVFFYTFVVLPFGLSSAPYVFTKMMQWCFYGEARALKQLCI